MSQLNQRYITFNLLIQFIDWLNLDLIKFILSFVVIVTILTDCVLFVDFNQWLILFVLKYWKLFETL